MGLRITKKYRTRSTLRATALQLFEQKGYGATTVEQIAAAAEVSLSTAFRYFRAKEDFVFDDPYDEALAIAFRAQPPDVSLVQCLRNALKQAFRDLSPDQQQLEGRRHRIIARTPELQPRQTSDYARSIDLLANLIGERLHISAASPDVRTLSGALAGVLISASQMALKHPSSDPRAVIDLALARFEADPLLAKKEKKTR